MSALTTTPSACTVSPDAHGRERHELRVVLVAQRQVQHEVLLAQHADARELVGERVGRGLLRALHRRRALLAVNRATPCTSVASTSIARAARQARDLVRRARRIRLLEIRRHDLVDLREVAEVDQQDRQLDDVVQRPARGAGDRAQVLEHLMRLCLDAFDQSARSAGSSPIWPDMYSVLPARIACE